MSQWKSSPDEVAAQARIRALRTEARAAGDWDRVQLCDVAEAGVAAPDGRLEIAGKSYDRAEARAALGI